MVSVTKPGSCLANSTVFMMHFVESSLNLSQRSTSKATRRSELFVCGGDTFEAFLFRGSEGGAYSAPDYLNVEAIKMNLTTCKTDVVLLTVVYLPSWQREGNVS